MTLTRPRGWLGLIAAGAILLAALFWGWLGDIPVKVQGKGIIIMGDGLSLALAPESGRVAKVLVGPGQEVRVGQELLSLDQLEVHGRVELLENRLAQAERLLRVASRQEAEQPEFLAGLKKSIREDRRELEAIQDRLLHGVKVRAAQVGTVVELFASPGQIVKEGQPLVSISPLPAAGVKVKAVLYVAVANSLAIRSGMPVSISPWGYDQKKQGLLTGKVNSVIRFTATPAGMMQVLKNRDLVRDLTQAGPVITVWVDLAGDQAGLLDSGGSGVPPLNGALCNASITIGRKRPIAYLFPGLK